MYMYIYLFVVYIINIRNNNHITTHLTIVLYSKYYTWYHLCTIILITCIYIYIYIYINLNTFM